MEQLFLEQSIAVRFAIMCAALLMTVFTAMRYVTWRLDRAEKQRIAYNKAMHRSKEAPPVLPPIEYTGLDPFMAMTAERWAHNLMQSSLNKPAETSIEEFKSLQKGEQNGR